LGKMKLLFVDDEVNILRSIRRILRNKRNDWEAFYSNCGKDALKILEIEDIDLIVTDAKMEEMDGIELLKRIRMNERTRDIPTIMLTGSSEGEIRKNALKYGVVEFLYKPVSAEEFILRLRNVLKLREISKSLIEKNSELEKTRLQVIRRLGKAAEFKDDDTGQHVIRVAHYAQLIAEDLELPQDLITLIFQTAPMHDIGKIGVSDTILKKTGRFTPEEYEIMKHHSQEGDRLLHPLTHEEMKMYQIHPQLGESILGEDETPLLKIAAEIALGHHEKWDGTGYPLGVKGENIPLTARIVALADIFDALSTERCYKPAYTNEVCHSIINEISGTHLDPSIVEIFNRRFDEFISIKYEYYDSTVNLMND